MLKKFPSDKINGTKKCPLFSFASSNSSQFLLLICDSLKLCGGFSIFDYVSFLSKFVFLFNKMHGLFDFKAS